jgi:hypothetical protein
VIVGAAVWIVRFVIHKVFIVDVIEPLWSNSGESVGELLGPHLFLIGNEPAGQTLPATYCEIDLAQAPEPDAAEYDWFDEQIARLGQSPGLNVLILHFERRLQSRRFNERKLALVERITNVLNRTVVIISATPPGLFFTPLSTAPGSEASSADWPRRWANLLTRFVVIPVNPVASAPLPTLPSTALFSNLATVGWREIVWRLNALGFALSTKFLEDERRDPLVGRFWKEILPYAWHPGRPALDLTQLLVEVGERAEAYYSDIWATCTPAEKVVLGQIAEEGFVNEKTKRTVRLLMARDLVRRQPQFALMTETFRQFVLSSSSQAEVDALEEQSSSTWDAIRWPFLTMLIAGVAFFFITQREAFNTALGTLTAAATVVPAIVKIASMFGDRRSAA